MPGRKRTRKAANNDDSYSEGSEYEMESDIDNKEEMYEPPKKRTKRTSRKRSKTNQNDSDNDGTNDDDSDIENISSNNNWTHERKSLKDEIKKLKAEIKKLKAELKQSKSKKGGNTGMFVELI